MSASSDSPAGAGESRVAAPPAGWAGTPSYPYSQYGPYGPYGPYPPARPRQGLRWPLLAVIAALAVGIGGAAAYLSHAPAGSSALASGGALNTSQIAAKVNPGLVDVVSNLSYEHAQSAGTGIVLTANGEVLTNNHVIMGATSVTVVDIGNGRQYQAKVVGYSRSEDVAVLQMSGASGLATAPIGDSGTAAVGQPIVTLGNAGGKGGTPSVATGQITQLNAEVTATDSTSGTSEHLTGLIAHDANIQQGDSGGPLVNSSAQVIGMDTAASSQPDPTGGTVTHAVAIPINKALSIARQITSGKSSPAVHIGPTPFLGVQVASAGQAAANGVPAGSGALLGGTVPGTPAEAAGLVAGDVITGLNDGRITSPDDLQAALRPLHPGDKVTLTWTDRSGQKRSGSLVLGSGPAG